MKPPDVNKKEKIERIKTENDLNGRKCIWKNQLNKNSKVGVIAQFGYDKDVPSEFVEPLPCLFSKMAF